MSVIVTDTGFSADTLGTFVALEDFSDQDTLLDLPNDVDSADIEKWFDQATAIRIPFPSFADGRGFSLARQLRQRGYTGRLRAFGHLISDQYFHARRAGFDEVEISEELAARQPEDHWKSEAEWDKETYQDRLFDTA